jgi:hypothetical protein
MRLIESISFSAAIFADIPDFCSRQGRILYYHAVKIAGTFDCRGPARNAGCPPAVDEFAQARVDTGVYPYNRERFDKGCTIPPVSRRVTLY